MTKNSPIDDQVTTIQKLKERLKKFVDERDWKQYHSPKSLSMSIAIEAAELMEKFQWVDNKDSIDLLKDEEKIKDIDKLATQDSLKVVDLSERELEGYDESEFPEPDSKSAESNWQRYIFILLLLVIVFGLVKLFVFRKKKTGLK